MHTEHRLRGVDRDSGEPSQELADLRRCLEQAPAGPFLTVQLPDHPDRLRGLHQIAGQVPARRRESRRGTQRGLLPDVGQHHCVRLRGIPWPAAGDPLRIVHVVARVGLPVGQQVRGHQHRRSRPQQATFRLVTVEFSIERDRHVVRLHPRRIVTRHRHRCRRHQTQRQRHTRARPVLSVDNGHRDHPPPTLGPTTAQSSVRARTDNADPRTTTTNAVIYPTISRVAGMVLRRVAAFRANRPPRLQLAEHPPFGRLDRRRRVMRDERAAACRLTP